MLLSASKLLSAMTPLTIYIAWLGLAGVATAWQSASTVTRTGRSNLLSRSSSSSSSSTSSNTRIKASAIVSMSSSSSSSSSLSQDGSRSDLSYSKSLSSSFLSAQSSPMVPSLQQNINQPPPRRRGQLHKDVVIIGGGLAGLSTALYLTQIDPERRITILDRNEDVRDETPGAGNMASMAAAGMLAPHSERLPKGDYLDLCLASKRMYVDFVALVEGMAQESGPEGHAYLMKDESSLEPWNIGYVASGGFLAPAFAGDNVATWAPPEDDDNDGTATGDGKKKKKKPPTAFWLDATQARELEPHLHPDVVGGWWFPEDASVDARRLTCSLKAACVGAGVEFLCGSRNEVTSLDLQDGVCKGLWLGAESARYVSAKSVLVANGAWMRNLLPVPLEPHKGQSLSLRMPGDRPPILRRVLFGGDSYIVPKADGRIVIGATVEAGSFDSNVTPAGIMHVLSHALQLVPGLADLPIEETWAGLRPTTPDKGPILGETPWENLFMAGGYWRNGVLLAPKTGQLLATLIANKGNGDALPGDDQTMLEAFAWDRFTSPEGGKRMAANSRYAASMYPVHRRKSGTGVAAAVGTELGSYSTARSAGEERSLDRKSLFGSGDDDSDAETEDLFEKAALMGQEDANVFEGFGDDSGGGSDYDKVKYYYSEQEPALRPGENTDAEDVAAPQTPVLEVIDSSPADESSPSEAETEATLPYDGSADAITVGSAANDDDEQDDAAANGLASNVVNGLASIYQSIRDNKSKQEVDLPDQNIKDDRPDPGFRISHVDKKTGQTRMIPPYTQPAEFFAGLEAEESKEEEPAPTLSSSEALADPVGTVADADDTAPPATKITAEGSGSASDKNYDETTFDGYQEIFKANASDNRQDELNKMKEARLKNRSSEPPREVHKK